MLKIILKVVSNTHRALNSAKLSCSSEVTLYEVDIFLFVNSMTQTNLLLVIDVHTYITKPKNVFNDTEA